MNAQSLETWDDLRYFLAVARTGTLTAAADELGVNHSTVYRRIGGLEEALGARLFERLPRGYALTEAGEDMLGYALRVEDELGAMSRKLLGLDRQMRGTVRLTTVEEMVSVIAPHLRGFHEQHPKIVIELNTDQRLLSLEQREADVAIRPGRRPRDGNVVGKKLADLRTGLYGSPDYLQQRGRPKSGRGLAGHDIVSVDSSLEHTEMYQWLIEQGVEDQIVTRCNTMLAIREAAKAGLGLAVLPAFVGESDPGLERLFFPKLERGHQLWLLLHRDLRQTARVRSFVDFISAALVESRPLFEGRARR
jgi:DNA-binding transcriptional LysR family regulator